MRRIGLLMLFAIGLLFTSCEGETTYLKRVENRSNYPIYVVYSALGGEQSDSVYVDPHTSETVYVQTTRGGNDSPENCLEDFNTIRISAEEPLTVTKDISQVSNWDQQITSGNKMGNVVQQLCLFTIDDEDFE